MTTVKNIYDYINMIAPFETQEEWDNSGHLVGEFRKEVKTVVMALDCTNKAVQFAKDINADLVLTHHPVIFRGLKALMPQSPVYELVKAGISQISTHTCFDKAEEGINQNLATILELENITKICDGFVALGELKQAMSIDDFVEHISNTLDCAGVRYTDTDKEIKKIAVGGGACGDFMWQALENADCFVTGELRYHDMLDASEQGLAVISAGHFETENLAFLMLRDKLEKIFTDVEFVIAPVQNPIKSI